MQQSKIIDSGKCGNNVNYELTKDVTLTIFGKGIMNYQSPFVINKNIIKIIIKYNVKSIGRNAFTGCTSLASIKIPIVLHPLKVMHSKVVPL